MKLYPLPYERFKIDTIKEEAECMELLRKNMEELTSFFKYKSDCKKDFQGQINKNYFEMIPTIEYRTSFFPFISGHIEEKNNVIIINISPHPFNFAIMVFWLAVSIIVTFVSPPIPGIFFFGFYCIFFLVFWVEAKKCKKKLIQFWSEEKL